MITEKQFENFAARQGVTPESAFLYELMKASWYAAEKTCFKSYNQVPALFGLPKEIPITIKLVDCEEDKTVLTRSDIQFLVDNIKIGLSLYEQEREMLSKNIQIMWQKCNPENTKTTPYFNALNELKDNKARLKQQFKKLAEIQRKLKRMR